METTRARLPLNNLAVAFGLAGLAGIWTVAADLLGAPGFAVVFFVAVAAGFAGWMLAHWISGNLRLQNVHGGYFLPTVAGGFIAAGALARVGLPMPGYAAFAVGMLFWLVIGTLILARVAVHPDLPGPLVPTLAIFVAPPAVAATSWFALAGPHDDRMSLFLAGTTVVLTLMQIALWPRYRKLPFSLGFWSFTFPYAAVARNTVEWLYLEQPPTWRLWSWVVVLAVTAFVVTIAVRTVSPAGPTDRPVNSLPPAASGQA